MAGRAGRRKRQRDTKKDPGPWSQISVAITAFTALGALIFTGLSLRMTHNDPPVDDYWKTGDSPTRDKWGWYFPWVDGRKGVSEKLPREGYPDSFPPYDGRRADWTGPYSQQT
jgi:hypothetical protein